MTTKTYSPGKKVPVSGQYKVVGSRGGETGEERGKHKKIKQSLVERNIIVFREFKTFNLATRTDETVSKSSNGES